jgi:hypothetical protein
MRCASSLAFHGFAARRCSVGLQRHREHHCRGIIPQPALPWDGFDTSFKGLPKSTQNARSLSRERLGWGGGKYSVGGCLPKVPPNVHLHVGWFNETLPPILDSPAGRGGGPVAFAHLDANIDDHSA